MSASGLTLFLTFRPRAPPCSRLTPGTRFFLRPSGRCAQRSPAYKSLEADLQNPSACGDALSNMRLKLPGDDRFKGNGVVAPRRVRTVVPQRCAGERVARSLSAIRWAARGGPPWG